jgi:hypothetical protein
MYYKAMLIGINIRNTSVVPFEYQAIWRNDAV